MPPVRFRAGRLLAQTATGVLLLVLLGSLSAIFLRQEITELGRWFVTTLGLWGLFLGVMAIDASPIPLPHEPLLFIVVTTTLDTTAVVAVCSLASITAACIGYGAGRVLRRQRLMERVLGARLTAVQAFVAQYGALGIAVAAVSPIPYGLSNWVAGALGLRLSSFALATPVRVIKVVVTVLLFEAGWSLGTAE